MTNAENVRSINSRKTGQWEASPEQDYDEFDHLLDIHKQILVIQKQISALSVDFEKALASYVNAETKKAQELAAIAKSKKDRVCSNLKMLGVPVPSDSLQPLTQVIAPSLTTQGVANDPASSLENESALPDVQEQEQEPDQEPIQAQKQEELEVQEPKQEQEVQELAVQEPAVIENNVEPTARKARKKHKYSMSYQCQSDPYIIYRTGPIPKACRDDAEKADVNRNDSKAVIAYMREVCAKRIARSEMKERLKENFKRIMDFYEQEEDKLYAALKAGKLNRELFNMHSIRSRADFEVFGIDADSFVLYRNTTFLDVLFVCLNKAEKDAIPEEQWEKWFPPELEGMDHQPELSHPSDENPFDDDTTCLFDFLIERHPNAIDCDIEETLAKLKIVYENITSELKIA